jgi:hypothetical protein
MPRLGLGLGIPFSRVLGGIDPQAQAFISAAGITDPTQINAINRLVLNYKGMGNLNTSVDLWTDSNAIYPIVGGSATTHMYNLKDPQNLDAAYRLAFSGGWTHSANGALPNGTNAFADTFLAPNALSQNSARMGYYSRTNNLASINRFEAGVLTNDFVNVIRWDGSLGNLSRINNGFTAGGYIPTKTSGMFTVSRTLSNLTEVCEDGVLKQTITAASVSRNSNPIYLGARNLGGVAGGFTDRQCAFFVIGAGLSVANNLLEYQIIQQFQTDLGRAV